MHATRPSRSRLLLWLLPLTCLAALAAAPFAAASTEPGARVVAARAVLLPAPSMSQMMMPMDAGMQHGDELQVVLELRNDTDTAQTVPFGRIALLGSDGTRVPATGGLVGDLELRPHAGAEERLRFPAPDGDRVRLSVPAGAGDGVLELTVGGSPSSGHHH
jgi:hypothetical protein